jgi:quinol monooxygenase YgiN
MGNDVVDPGNSMTSKLIQKLKGTSGTQMPLDQDPLDDTTINLIETWIDEGALEEPLDN